MISENCAPKATHDAATKFELREAVKEEATQLKCCEEKRDFISQGQFKSRNYLNQASESLQNKEISPLVS